MGGSLGKEKGLGGDEVRTVKEGSLYWEARRAVFTVQRIGRLTIPKIAKLAGKGNPQVLVLQLTFQFELHP